MKKSVVILCKGNPNPDEVALRDLLRSEGCFARLVSVPSGPIKREERERCDVAYSFHRDLLKNYDSMELVVPGGVKAASSGYSLQRKGRWVYVIDADGNRVNDKGLSEEAASELLKGL
jgi:hypothetical protein